MSDYFGKEVPKLGFGLMRLPHKGLGTDTYGFCILGLCTDLYACRSAYGSADQKAIYKK